MFGNIQGFGGVEARSVAHHDGLFVFRNRRCKLLQKDVDNLCVELRAEQSCGVASLWTNRADDPQVFDTRFIELPSDANRMGPTRWWLCLVDRNEIRPENRLVIACRDDQR